MALLTTAWEWLHSHALSLPSLAKFALGMGIIVGIPSLCHRARLPAVVGLIPTKVKFQQRYEKRHGAIAKAWIHAAGLRSPTTAPDVVIGDGEK
jgi:hypothetical protein